MYSVLIVDDEPYIRKGLCKYIQWEDYGFTIVGEAASGHDAIKFISHQKVDVVITDIKMSGMNGFELIDHLNIKQEHPYYIILSGYSEFEYARKAIEREVVHYLLKPIQEDELLEVLEKIQQKLKKEKRTPIEIISISADNCRPKKIILEMLNYIETNLSDAITLDDLSSRFGMNSNYIGQLIKKQLGVNFSQLISSMRMERAKRLLENTSHKSYEIALLVGYRDARYFSQVFRKKYGMTPTECREKNN